MGGVDWADSGGHRLEEGSEGRMGSHGKSNIAGIQLKSVDMDQVYDKG